MLVIPILLCLLFLTKGALQLGEARMKNVFNAEQKAYTDAIHSSPPAYTSGALQPLDGFSTIPRKKSLPVEDTVSTATRIRGRRFMRRSPSEKSPPMPVVQFHHPLAHFVNGLFQGLRIFLVLACRGVAARALAAASGNSETGETYGSRI